METENRYEMCCTYPGTNLSFLPIDTKRQGHDCVTVSVCARVCVDGVCYGVRGVNALSKTTNRIASTAEWNKTRDKQQGAEWWSGLCEQALVVRVRRGQPTGQRGEGVMTLWNNIEIQQRAFPSSSVHAHAMYPAQPTSGFP